MNFLCNAEFIAKENKVSSKGNHYTTILFNQGTDTMTVMVSENVAQMNFEKGKEYAFELAYNRRFKDFRMVNAYNKVANDK